MVSINSSAISDILCLLSTSEYAVRLRALHEERLRILREQIERWHEDDLERLKERMEQIGRQLEQLESREKPGS
jgi:hypothetical protein